MREEDYLRVRKVLEQSKMAFEQTGGDYQKLTELCSVLWRREFEEYVPLDLSGADLRGGIFAGAKLRDANLRNAYLDNSQWFMAGVEGADFTSAQLKYSLLFVVHADATTKFEGTDFSGSSMAIMAAPHDFSGSNLTNASIKFIGSYAAGRVKAIGATVTGLRIKGDKTAVQSFVATLTSKQRSEVEVSGSRCFIATAACGPRFSADLEALRGFRDDYVSQTCAGCKFLAFYDVVSPPIAAWIARRSWRRILVRAIVVRPLVGIVRIARTTKE